MRILQTLAGAGLLLLSALAAAAQQSSGLDLNAVDKSVDPCTDFYQYACGNWIAHNPVAADESHRDRFVEINDRNQAVLHDILESSAKHQDASQIDHEIGGFYASCMNEDEVDKRGTAPLEPELKRIAAINNQQDLVDEIGRLAHMQVYVFFNFTSQPNPKDASQMQAVVDQDGLGLPERDYYFRDDAKSKEIRDKYVQYAAKLFELSGIPKDEATNRANRLLAFETQIAKPSLDVTARRDPQALVHQMTRPQLETVAPAIDWNKYFGLTAAPAFSTLNVTEPDYLKAISHLIATASMEDIRNYVAFHFINTSADVLPKAFVDASFSFNSQTLSGVNKIKPRWKRCVSMTDSELGEALGQKFVQKTFGEEGKQRTLQMVHQIEAEMGKDIEDITWMSPATKAEAQAKLKAVAEKIGYPDVWRDYSSIRIDPSDYFGNYYRCNEFESNREVKRIGQPTDKNEWEMTPPTVNAYYDPTQNNINFPAGILQPPFYSNKADDAVNYGGVGLVIGHELTHAFDDEGRQFDPKGNLRDWWQKSDEEQFEKKADCIVQEYNQFEPIPGVKVNGKLTLGENVADNGGLRLAYAALMDDLTKKAIPSTTANDGYTEAQQFFLSYAQSWCQNVRPEQVRLWAQTDPHAPAQFRIDGVLQNMPEFSAAFGCKPGQKMYAANSCRVW